MSIIYTVDREAGNNQDALILKEKMSKKGLKSRDEVLFPQLFDFGLDLCVFRVPLESGFKLAAG